MATHCSLFDYLMEHIKKTENDFFFLDSDRTGRGGDLKLKEGRFRFAARRFFYCDSCKTTEADCSEDLWMPQPWKCSVGL